MHLKTSLSMTARRGFTLLELLLALFIFTIIAMILVTALHSVLNNQARVEKSAARLTELQIAFTLLSRDFEQTIDRPITNANGSVEAAFLGGNIYVTFSHAGLVNPLGQLPRSTLQRTRYRLDDGYLIRDTWSALDQTQQSQPDSRRLLQDVREVSFQYLDQKGNFQNRWPPPDQPSNNDLPSAVRVFITFRDLGKMSQLYVIPKQKQTKTTP